MAGRYQHHMQAGIGAVYVRAGIGPARLYLPLRSMRGAGCDLRFTLRRCDALRLAREGIAPGLWWGRWLGDAVEWVVRRAGAAVVLLGRLLPRTPWPCPTLYRFAG